MEQRINPYEKGYNSIQPLFSLSAVLAKSSIEVSLQELISFRVSQINGCAYCLDMHSKDLRAAGETEQRLYMLDAWRETNVYTKRERAAFAWAEAVNKLTDNNVPDQVYNESLEQFSETELVDLTLVVIGINNFNRLNIAFRVQGGNYKPGMHKV
ncbi:carboxymuconolactone decarboxylase family protein [Mucilaginibacter sp. X4EP1]|jgi:AhpD family alkylhydroperoxidase|uniref:carboxymuconolactone decarboxylase family protein n=1 Tax=Mucilaginibacter sp. X4EP1 TaxID=2723092 RepID=UPI00216827A3|nr:carboxymuconolactone decarboxylase family protein [Mucilaginibacter sp. X4EP1]MCS3815944.1 AhpD family alkylhydroperoxidase [Mucilaginibacter sp. X4EP1]